MNTTLIFGASAMRSRRHRPAAPGFPRDTQAPSMQPEVRS
jgi:hypothetical protein